MQFESLSQVDQRVDLCELVLLAVRIDPLMFVLMAPVAMYVQT